MYTYKAHIVDVYDGDTVTAIVDLGFHVSKQIKVRLKDIDAPELRGNERSAGLVSKARLEELVLNKDVLLITFKDKQEKYGRWLGEIFTADSPDTVNSILLNEGLAILYKQ